MNARTTPWLATILLAATLATAAPPTTRPVVLAPTTPAVPYRSAELIDYSKPAFIPKFAQVNNPPAGPFAERDYAYRFTYPAYYGYGYCGGWAFCGYGSGSWGSTFTAWR